MAEVFTILDDGETLITGEWVPDPSDFEARLIGLSRSLENMTPLLVAARQLAIDSTAAHFDSQSDPQGNPWTPLDPDYLIAKGKAGYPTDEILVRTGAGKAAATSEGAYFITEDAVWFNPSALPDYMALHQSGTVSAGVTEALGRLRTKTATRADMQVSIAGTGRGNALPKREFIGFDEIDILALEDLINNWFEAVFVEEFPVGGNLGVETRTGFNMLGEFPIMSFTGRGQPILRTPGGPRFGRK